MNIDLELYRIFEAVARNQNITKAAQELHISQPAISKRIHSLESQLGGTLFIRTKRATILTEEGKIFYEYIKQAMQYIASAENKFTELVHLETGHIRIGTSTTLTKEFLIPYLKKFHESYPKIQIDLVTELPDEMLKMLRNGLLDIVLLNLNGRKQEEDIEIIKWKKINDCFVASNKYASLKEKEISIAELNDYPIILQRKNSNTRTFLDDYLEKKHLTITPNMEVATISMAIALAKANFGIAYITKEYVKKELHNQELFEIHTKEKIPSRWIGIAISKTHHPSFSTNQLIIEMKEGKEHDQRR